MRQTNRRIAESDRRLAISAQFEQADRMKALENELVQERHQRAEENRHFDAVRQELAVLRSQRFISAIPFSATQPRMLSDAGSFTVPPFPSFGQGGSLLAPPQSPVGLGALTNFRFGNPFGSIYGSAPSPFSLEEYRSGLRANDQQLPQQPSPTRADSQQQTRQDHMTKVCGQCGTSLEEGRASCARCGVLVKAPPPPPPRIVFWPFRHSILQGSIVSFTIRLRLILA